MDELRPTAKTIPELATELRMASYALPSEGDWVFHGGMLMPQNVCSHTAQLIEWMAGHIEEVEAEVLRLRSTHQRRF